MTQLAIDWGRAITAAMRDGARVVLVVERERDADRRWSAADAVCVVPPRVRS